MTASAPSENAGGSSPCWRCSPRAKRVVTSLSQLSNSRWSHERWLSRPSIPIHVTVHAAEGEGEISSRGVLQSANSPGPDVASAAVRPSGPTLSGDSGTVSCARRAAEARVLKPVVLRSGALAVSAGALCEGAAGSTSLQGEQGGGAVPGRASRVASSTSVASLGGGGGRWLERSGRRVCRVVIFVVDSGASSFVIIVIFVVDSGASSCSSSTAIGAAGNCMTGASQPATEASSACGVVSWGSLSKARSAWPSAQAVSPSMSAALATAHAEAKTRSRRPPSESGEGASTRKTGSARSGGISCHAALHAAILSASAALPCALASSSAVRAHCAA